MRKPMSLRLRVTLLCAALLTLCCLLLTVTNNFSAIRMADAIQAVPLLPAQRAELEDSVSLPMAELHISDTIQQAQGAFHMQSLLAMVAILALGLFLIYRLVGKALAPLDTLTCQIRERTAADLAQPVEIPDSGDEAAALALAFNQMSQRLNQVFVMQRNFSRSAAHEFRTPLAVLKTRIGLFRKKQDFSPQTTEDFLLYPFLVKFNLIDHGRSFRFHRISDDGGLGTWSCLAVFAMWSYGPPWPPIENTTAGSASSC